MDIYITTTPELFEKLLKKKDFEITWKKNHFSAMHHVSRGRYHILYLKRDGKIFCDFHFDNKIHGIGMGADYGVKPEAYFDKYLKNELKLNNIGYETRHVNWFTRKNKAIITGVRF
jgi:hypothetical protein